MKGSVFRLGCRMLRAVAKSRTLVVQTAICVSLVSVAACSAKQDYGEQFASTCKAQGLVPGSVDYDRCMHNLISQQRAREELERSQFETLQSIDNVRSLLPH